MRSEKYFFPNNSFTSLLFDKTVVKLIYRFF